STVVGVDFADADAAFDTSFGNGLVHGINAVDECRLAASRGTNQSGGVIGSHFQIDVVQCLTFAVPGIQALDLDSTAHRLCGSKRTTPDRDANRRDRRDDKNDENE